MGRSSERSRVHVPRPCRLHWERPVNEPSTTIGLATIATGVGIGVGVGVTTALILGIYRWVVRYRDRREQISYIREVIVTNLERILSAGREMPSEAIEVPDSKMKITADHIRFPLFRALEDELKVALSYRATALTYKEIAPLKRVLATTHRVMTDLRMDEYKILPSTIAEKLHNQFMEIDWLKIPASFPEEGAS